MKTRWIVGSLCVSMLMAVGMLQAEDKSAEKKFAATCPVSGKPAGESHVLEIKSGEKVYFCCDNCPKGYEKEPKKFTLAVHRQLLETGQIVQVACPMTGKPINQEAKAETGNAEVAFCCKGCLGKFDKADDEAKLKMLFAAAAFKKGFTNQTTCPVSGKPINPEAVVEYKNKKVYFCCPNCPAAFEADPKKFLEKLPQFNKNKKSADAAGE